MKKGIFLIGVFLFSQTVFAEETFSFSVNKPCDAPALESQLQPNSDTCRQRIVGDAKLLARCLDGVKKNVSAMKNKCNEWKSYCGGLSAYDSFSKFSQKLKKDTDAINKDRRQKNQSLISYPEILASNQSGWSKCKSGKIVSGWHEVKKSPTVMDGSGNEGTVGTGAGEGATSGKSTGAGYGKIKMCVSPSAQLADGDQIQVSPYDSDEPLCMNSAYGMENYQGHEFTAGSLYPEATGPQELQKNYSGKLREHLKQRMKGFGVDLDFAKNCTGKDIPEDLFNYKFEDTDEIITPERLANPGPALNKKLKDQCLRIEFNPKVAEWIRMVNMASKTFKFKDKDTGAEYKCENISDEKHCGGSIACLNNQNVVSAKISGLSLGFSARDSSTYVPTSDVRGICTALKSKTNSSKADQVRIFQEAADKYKEICRSKKYITDIVETVSSTVSTVVIVSGAVAVTTVTGGGTVAIIMTSSLTSGAVAAISSKNACESQSVIGYEGVTAEQVANIKYECLTRAGVDGMTESFFSALTAGINPGVSQGFQSTKNAVAKQLFKEGFDEGLDISREMMKSSIFKNKLKDYGLRTAEGFIQNGADYGAAWATCKGREQLGVEVGGCNPQDLIKSMAFSKVVGGTITKSMNIKQKELGRALTPDEKKTIVDQAKKDPKWVQAEKDINQFFVQRKPKSNTEPTTLIGRTKTSNDTQTPTVIKPSNKNTGGAGDQTGDVSTSGSRNQSTAGQNLKVTPDTSVNLSSEKNVYRNTAFNRKEFENGKPTIFFRGVRLENGKEFATTFESKQNGGQMASRDPNDALHYAIMPAGPTGFKQSVNDDIVITVFKSNNKNKDVYDPYPEDDMMKHVIFGKKDNAVDLSQKDEFKVFKRNIKDLQTQAQRDEFMSEIYKYSNEINRPETGKTNTWTTRATTESPVTQTPTVKPSSRRSAGAGDQTGDGGSGDGRMDGNYAQRAKEQMLKSDEVLTPTKIEKLKKDNPKLAQIMKQASDDRMDGNFMQRAIEEARASKDPKAKQMLKDAGCE